MKTPDEQACEDLLKSLNMIHASVNRLHAEARNTPVAARMWGLRLEMMSTLDFVHDYVKGRRT